MFVDPARALWASFCFRFTKNLLIIITIIITIINNNVISIAPYLTAKAEHTALHKIKHCDGNSGLSVLTVITCRFP